MNVKVTRGSTTIRVTGIPREDFNTVTRELVRVADDLEWTHNPGLIGLLRPDMSFKDFVFKDIYQALEALNQMNKIAFEHGQLTIQDVYDILGIGYCNPEENAKCGWTRFMINFVVMHVRNGCKIVYSNPEELYI